MRTFWEWLAQLRLAETYVTFDPKQYDQLFDEELEKVIARSSDAKHRQALEKMRGFGWLGYIAAAVRNSGYRDQRDVQELAHDIAVKLLMGRLFTGFDERVSGPMDLRFKRSVGNAVRNMVELEQNRRRFLPTVPIDQRAELGGMTSNDGGEKVIRDFRRLVHRRLGDIGTAVLNVRLAGGEIKGLVGRHDLGSPGKWIVKRTVQQVKELLRQYAASLGDPGFLRDIEKAMGREEDTIERRRRAMTARQAVGA